MKNSGREESEGNERIYCDFCDERGTSRGWRRHRCVRILSIHAAAFARSSALAPLLPPAQPDADTDTVTVTDTDTVTVTVTVTEPHSDYGTRACRQDSFRARNLHQPG